MYLPINITFYVIYIRIFNIYLLFIDFSARESIRQQIPTENQRRTDIYDVNEK